MRCLKVKKHHLWFHLTLEIYQHNKTLSTATLKSTETHHMVKIDALKNAGRMPKGVVDVIHRYVKEMRPMSKRGWWIGLTPWLLPGHSADQLSVWGGLIECLKLGAWTGKRLRWAVWELRECWLSRPLVSVAERRFDELLSKLNDHLEKIRRQSRNTDHQMH